MEIQGTNYTRLHKIQCECLETGDESVVVIICLAEVKGLKKRAILE